MSKAGTCSYGKKCRHLHLIEHHYNEWDCPEDFECKTYNNFDEKTARQHYNQYHKGKSKVKTIPATAPADTVVGTPYKLKPSKMCTFIKYNSIVIEKDDGTKEYVVGICGKPIDSHQFCDECFKTLPKPAGKTKTST